MGGTGQTGQQEGRSLSCAGAGPRRGCSAPGPEPSRGFPMPPPPPLSPGHSAPASVLFSTEDLKALLPPATCRHRCVTPIPPPTCQAPAAALLLLSDSEPATWGAHMAHQNGAAQSPPFSVYSQPATTPASCSSKRGPQKALPGLQIPAPPLLTRSGEVSVLGDFRARL